MYRNCRRDLTEHRCFSAGLDEMLYNISMKGLDSNYIHMPEHNIRVALNTGSHGIHSTYAARTS